ncbi:amidohydrolase family protein [Rhodoplanes elegans]|nr:amidohydrolase family protein [Rhodoplanes elegans]
MITRRTTLASFASWTVAMSSHSLSSGRAAEGPVATARAPAVRGPDPHPRTPAFRLPAGTVDTHMHIFGPISKYPYADARSYTPPEALLTTYQALQRTLGVQRAVLVNATVHGTDNTIVADAIATDPKTYRGVAAIDDSLTDKQIEALDKAGFKGCRFTFVSRLRNAPDTRVFDRVVDQIKGLGWHVDLYIEPDKVETLLPMLRKLPLRYVIDHMGDVKAAAGIEQPGFKALVELLRSDEKCWMKVTCPERVAAAGAPFDDVVPFARKLVEAAPDRVLWGTDWPHPNVKFMPNDGDLVDLVPRYAPDPVLQRKLLVENPQTLYGFDPV